jgi:outer membrane protein assembly factor BamB
LKENWSVPVGTGHASPVVAGGKVCVFVRHDDADVFAMALDARTGKLVWTSGYKVDYQMHEAARAHGKGPKATPVVAAGRVYTLGITGVLSASPADSGEILWQNYLDKEFPKTSPLFGTAQSPLVADNLVIAHVGGHDNGALRAFDAATGKVKWSWAGDGPAYASPVVATLAGTRQIVNFTQKAVAGVELSTGKLLWQIPSKSQYDENSATVVVYKDTIIYSPEGKGLTAVRLVKQGATLTPQVVWNNPDPQLYMSTPVVEGNLLYGLSSKKKGQFFCLDADTGKTVWQAEGRAGENASLVNAGRVLLALTTDSVLYVLPAGAKGFAPVAQYQVAKSPVWAHPAVAGSTIFVKDETTLASLSLKN